MNWMADGDDQPSPPSPACSVNAGIDHMPPVKNRRNRERNRVAAHKCRQKAKQSMSELQIRERELSQQNRILLEHAGSLRDEILDLKNEILKHSNCDSDIIQNYISRAARDVH
ncbi:putative bzip transcription factor protein [Daldinia childiae]|uniref:putative bzip transcription factor protein n=1 Tax=Daldinia childiae TaxID=326645 RepID=UPI001447B1C6|nr:putative bzip transcription factor protein [Daldinia childiae]KAF3062267.1 putative bzip transcription factor protein [Daldinia childiae]